MTITNCLGESRPVTQTWPDGSFSCPFCAAAVIAPAPRCENPGCSASHYCFDATGTPKPAVVSTFEKLAVELRRRAEEAARRQRDHEWAMEYARERNAAHAKWEQDTIEEARRRGCCLRCVIAPGWETAKFIKHRGPCPKERSTVCVRLSQVPMGRLALRA